jgi:hypothetical protein
MAIQAAVHGSYLTDLLPDLVAAAGMALRASNTRGEPTAQPDHLPESHRPMAAPELTDQAPPTPAHIPQQGTQPR